MGQQRTENGEIVVSDPRAIRALAHPARVAVLERLFGGAVLTATECARVAGLTPSAMSYHLRALERFGLVGRAAASGDGRERPWRALGTGMRVGAALVTSDLRLTPAEARALTGAVNDLLEPYSARTDEPADALACHAYWVVAPASAHDEGTADDTAPGRA